MVKSTVKSFEVVVSGRVQGVGFRYSAVNQARLYGIKGYVKNLPSGQVRLDIEGSATATGLMLKWCGEGPSTGRVSDVNVYECSPKGYDSFEVRY